MLRSFCCATAALLISGCGGDTSSDAYFYPDSAHPVSLQDGTYHWKVIDEPRFAGSIDAVAARSAKDVWFFGRDARHWDGKKMSSFALDAAGTPGEPDGAHHAQSYVIRADNDIWAAGSALWHYDGAAWTEMTLQIPGVANPPTATRWNHFEVTGDETQLFVLFMSRGGEPFTGGDYGLEVDGTFLPAYVIEPVIPNIEFTGSRAPVYDFMPTHFSNAGVMGNVGAGVNDAARMLIPCLRNAGVLWAREGERFYSFKPGAIGPGGLHEALFVTEAQVPGDFETAGSLPFSKLPGIGDSTTVFLGPPKVAPQFSTAISLQLSAMTAGGGSAFYALFAHDAAGDATHLLRLREGKVSILKDRLYGWRAYAMGMADDRMFVAASGGAVLMGTVK